MKNTLLILLTLTSLSAFASEGTIKVSRASNRENTINLSIQGDAAKSISKQLKINGTSFKRDPFSGALVQIGEGVRCIDQDSGKAFYCHLSITGKTVN